MSFLKKLYDQGFKTKKKLFFNDQGVCQFIDGIYCPIHVQVGQITNIPGGGVTFWDHHRP
jgi:hypothetical protein